MLCYTVVGGLLERLLDVAVPVPHLGRPEGLIILVIVIE